MIIKLKNNETQLISRCKKNDRKAQKELFELHAPVMLAVCRRYISDIDTAEGVMLNNFMKVFQKLDQFNFEGSFQGWIRRIMINGCLTWIRKNKIMYKEIDIDECGDDLNLESINDHLEAEDLMELISELPQGYGAVFNLYAIEGYNHQEIAKELDISTGTSKSQLSRARKYLQNRLKSLEKAELTRPKNKNAG
ncbi:MAG: RNA polymerase sigma factor [Reichenbachiella sp.]